MRIPKKRKPTGPGQYIKKYIIEGQNISQAQLATLLNTTRKTINLIVLEKQGISLDMAHRLSKLTKTNIEFWLNAQRAVEIWEYRHSKSYKNLPNIKPLLAS